MSTNTNKQCQPSTIVFTGGGTAGHILPGLAVIERLIEHAPGMRLAWIGCGKPLEYRLVTEASNGEIEYHSTRAKPIPKRPIQAISAGLQNAIGLAQAIRQLRRLRPTYVVATGGYVCLPTSIAARMLRIPRIVIEPNLVIGRANRLLARHASMVCLGHESTARQLPDHCKTMATGVPVRQDILRLAERRQNTDGNQRHLLIIGGSSGDRWINTHFPGALARLAQTGRLDNWRVTHQTGVAHHEAASHAYTNWSNDTETPLRVVPYIDDLPEQLADSDLVISRAGASTLAELSVLATPTVLVPFARSAEDHQRRAAKILGDAGAAAMIDPKETAQTEAETKIIETIGPLLEDKIRRDNLAKQIRNFGNPNAAAEIAALILGDKEEPR